MRRFATPPTHFPYTHTQAETESKRERERGYTYRSVYLSAMGNACKYAMGRL